MWRKIGRAIGVIVGWGVILAYIVVASSLADSHRAEQTVAEVVIEMRDSSEMQRFASSERIRRQLKQSGLEATGKSVESVDAVKIAECVSKNGFVSDADVYVTYSGTLHIDVNQHKPVMRLMSGGVNSYITAEGDIFRSPQGAAYYAPVVTGGYRPLFASSYEGTLASLLAEKWARQDERLVELGKERKALNASVAECKRHRGELRKDRKKSFFESREHCNQRRVAIDAKIGKCDKQLAEYAKQEMQLTKRQQGIELRKKKLRKSYDDFANLITFVSTINEDSFWGAEVVQFVADTLSTGEISLRLVPRSGDFIIEFGTLDNSEKKLAKLYDFYDDGLSQVGWDRFKVVDVRYKNQVICTE